MRTNGWDSATTERLTELLARCYDDPDLFNTCILGRPPYWKAQREIAESVCYYRITVAYTGNALGKDFLFGGLIPWWMLTRHNSLAIVTGPSQTSLGSITWKELRKAVQQSLIPVPAKLSEGMKASPQTMTLGPGWQALGYSTTSIERASGQHNRKLLVGIMEASGVADEIWDAVDSLKYTRLFAYGNPIRAEGRFVELIRQAEEDRRNSVPRHLAVNAIQVPSTASPHAHLDESPFGLADATWLVDVARRYGTDSLWYRSHVLAEIPEVSSDDLLPKAWLDYAAAIDRPNVHPTHPVHKTRRISVDLGEGVGRDSTAILVRDDHGILDLVAGRTLSLAAAAQEVARLALAYKVDHGRISYDKLGIGRDFGNHLARHGITAAIPYAGSGRAQDPKAFVNLRSEAAWKLRRRLNPEWVTDLRFPSTSRQQAFHIPPRGWWSLLREDLEALTYDLVGNKTRLIAKDDLLIRLGRSPDRGDALIQSFAFD